MPLERLRQALKENDWAVLFIEELGWDHYEAKVEVTIEAQTFVLTTCAHKRGMVVYICTGTIPPYSIRRKTEREITKTSHEHIIIYTDKREKQIWQWARREPGKPTVCREHTYFYQQNGDSLLQKLQSIAFSLSEEENLTIHHVTRRASKAFDVDHVTKKFYERFQKEHNAFLQFIQGIKDEEKARWYASVMLNRLMFIYFFQKKGFLHSDVDYLRNRLKQSEERGANRFYPDFLCPLFFEGLAQKESERSLATQKLLGNVPYLNGGIFLRHQIEELYTKTIQIDDCAFERLFDFFDQYQWYLDERALKNDNEINPDVLGYIFEKYINQKQMGAYYTKEDITDYIGKNTIIPRLFDMAKQKCKIAFEGENSTWQLLQSDPDRYIYDAVKKGVNLPLPEEIAAGLKEVSCRTQWNKSAPSEYALPTEIWREVVARRERYEEVKSKILAGEIKDINDLITYNLNIRQFAQDVLENCEGTELLRAFWYAMVGRIPEKSNEKFEPGLSILDPTCGSGAFLFAALNILEPLYEACLSRMQVFIAEEPSSRPEKFADFRKILKRVEEHPNRRYFIFKTIIVNNLYGVDIMEEAIEICKLRLFLKLIAQIETTEKIEPLPDIDFNIRAGNTLVGYASEKELDRVFASQFDFDDNKGRIQRKAEELNRLFQLFRQQQLELGGEIKSEDKQKLRQKLQELDDELNHYLAGEYGEKNPLEYELWRKSHKPFHWFIEFYGILKNGGFDVIIGNPPYVEYSKVKKEYTVRGYETEECGNLYAFAMERTIQFLIKKGRIGIIIPVASVCTDGYSKLQEKLQKTGNLVISSFNDRPGKLFEGLEHIRLSIILCEKESTGSYILSTKYNKWQTIARPYLFYLLKYFKISNLIREGSFPKVSEILEQNILYKLFAQTKTLAYYMEEKGEHALYYTRKLSYFVQITNFIPCIYNSQGELREPSELKKIMFDSQMLRDIFLALLNSNLFY